MIKRKSRKHRDIFSKFIIKQRQHISTNFVFQETFLASSFHTRYLASSIYISGTSHSSTYSFIIITQHYFCRKLKFCLSTGLNIRWIMSETFPMPSKFCSYVHTRTEVLFNPCWPKKNYLVHRIGLEVQIFCYITDHLWLNHVFMVNDIEMWN